MNVDKTILSLEHKFAEKSEIALNMKINGDTVYVENYGDRFHVYFSAICEVKTYNDIRSLAEMLCEYPKVLTDIENEHNYYREDQIPKLIKFYEENIEGKSREEVSGEVWEQYSDWYKDIYGYRPNSYTS